MWNLEVIAHLHKVAEPVDIAPNVSKGDEPLHKRKKTRHYVSGFIVMPVNAAPRLLYSRKEAAFLLSMSTRSLDYLVAEGRLKARRLGGRVLIHHTDLERLARDGDQAAMKPAA